MPNLVWLPSWIAPLTDRHESHVQELLQRTSIALFRTAPVERPLVTYAEGAWGRLVEPGAGAALPLEELALFEPRPPFFRRRVASMDKFVSGCDSVQLSGTLTSKLICSRYTEGLPQLPSHVIASFGEAIRTYRDAVRETLD